MQADLLAQLAPARTGRRPNDGFSELVRSARPAPAVLTPEQRAARAQIAAAKAELGLN